MLVVGSVPYNGFNPLLKERGVVFRDVPL